MDSIDPVIPRFKAFYQDFGSAQLDRLAAIYHDKVVFRDPVHEIRGLVELEDYMGSLLADLDDCRFEYLDELSGGSAAYIKWLMHFRHPKLGSRQISVRGVSHLHIEDNRIAFHEDFYDLGAMLYEQVPLVGNVTRWLKLRLAS